jgi:hypothetical protein
MESGVVYGVHGGHSNAVAPWQHSFLTWSVGHTAELGFAGAATFRNWLAKFEIGLMTDWQTNPTQGYCWLEASGSKIQVKDSAGNWLPSYTAVYGATFPTLAGLACNSPAMVKAMGKLEGDQWQAGEMHAYPYSATGYPSNLQIGLAVATDTGLPAAHDAWTIFDSRSIQPSGSKSYNNYPNFAVMPRFPSGAAAIPPSQPSSGPTRNITLPVWYEPSTVGTAQPNSQSRKLAPPPQASKASTTHSDARTTAVELRSHSRFFGVARVAKGIFGTLRNEIRHIASLRTWHLAPQTPVSAARPVSASTPR